MGSKLATDRFVGIDVSKSWLMCMCGLMVPPSAGKLLTILKAMLRDNRPWAAAHS